MCVEGGEEEEEGGERDGDSRGQRMMINRRTANFKLCSWKSFFALPVESLLTHPVQLACCLPRRESYTRVTVWLPILAKNPGGNM